MILVTVDNYLSLGVPSSVVGEYLISVGAGGAVCVRPEVVKFFKNNPAERNAASGWDQFSAALDAIQAAELANVPDKAKADLFK